jgi:PAS domain S-box-containing protein
MPERADRVLVVDDDVAFVRFLREMLRRSAALRIRHIEVATTAVAARAAISRGQYDVALIDYRLDTSDGLTLLGDAVERWPDRPVILLTGSPEADLSGRAYRRGATDYLHKTDLSEETLYRALRYAFDRLEATRALSLSEERFRRFFTRSPAPAWQVSMEGRILDANPAAADVMGFERATDMIGLDSAILYADIEDRQRFRDALQRGAGQVHNYEMRLKRRDGADVWGLVNATLDYDQRGTPTTIEAMMVDITGRRQAEIQRRQAETMEAVSTFAGRVFDEVDALLGVIGREVAHAADGPADAARLRACLARIADASERAGVLRQELAEVSGSRALQPGAGADTEAALDFSGPRPIPVDAPAQDDADGTAPTCRPVVLLVEDEDTVRRLAARMLGRADFDVVLAETPAAALEIAASPERRIDLLLTDVVMPEMTGIELARRVKALRPAIRAVFMSGYSADIVADRDVVGDDALIVQKPFSALELVRALRDASNEQ